ncbi:MAG: hypothetical protein WBC04_15200 [Candidatus Acidiferrales bacterium]
MKAAGDPMNSPHRAIFILEAAVDCRVPKTLAPAGSQVLETARAENAVSGVPKTIDFVEKVREDEKAASLLLYRSGTQCPM